MPSKLTTTSYCLLGLLSGRSWSSYEITQLMKSGGAISQLWPRTEANLYREQKNLVAHGLATATSAQTGRRSRTVYEITDEGRRALKNWLAEPAELLRLEFETAVKIHFGDAGRLEDVKAHLARLSAAADFSGVARYAEILERWLVGDMLMPDRVQYTAMTVDLINRIYGAVAEWASDWGHRVEEWQSVDLHDVSEAQARETIASLLDQVRR